MISLWGSIVDLLTPFDGDGLDEQGFGDLVAWQMSEGIHGLATCTTTGEGPTLTTAEKDRLISICAEVSAGRVPVIAATGTNGTDSTIALTRMAKAAGADAVLVVTPYYSRPSQEGIYRHFEALARAVDLPIILHNLPSRTGVNLLPMTIGRLSRIASIVGICDQSSDPLRVLATARTAGEQFVQLCGSDAQALAFNLAGGQGSLSVVANLLPRVCATQQIACRQGRYDLARNIHWRLAELMEALNSDTVPVPVKIAMGLVRLGFGASYRLPLVEGTLESQRAVSAALKGLLADPFLYPVVAEKGFSLQQERLQPLEDTTCKLSRR
ncbi:4-hydroxy-tetrahydrodipicolinate synthase [Lichenifustis flavocetrariae]|uniref:4-hydroxy-tetrahydrodipicolinate synthase n=1 Tax=Lichenifustis flavocetrariae TaxID=2949735 RepID=A0AA41Z4M8_9HYPH|nr:4-hydroxy-tetrahydrodipicolinate synthase [Lichenifustis flavocetrariae]MCW6512868.1 4-hydroxy-tetrahydrodipicolinate synthase [Lichenifustis flavocetrariae]